MDVILANPLLTIPLLVVLPVLLLPFLMRFVVGRVVLSMVKRRYLPEYRKELLEGWESEGDRAAMKEACAFAFDRLKFHFVIRPDFKADLRVLFLVIKNAYNPGSDPSKEEYRFSLRRLVECFFLAFCDLYRDYADKRWFKTIARFRLIWFFRVVNLGKYYRALFSLPAFPFLQSTRILGRILRLLLIPVFGIPMVVVDVLKSVFMSLFYEGYFRFLYGLLLMKIAYYGLYLYGRENSVVSKRIKSIPRERVNGIFADVEKAIDPASFPGFSAGFDDAVKAYGECLADYGLARDPVYRDERPGLADKARNILDRIRTVVYKAYGPKPRGETGSLKLQDQAYGLYRRISECYAPRAKEPLLRLRIHELIECGYMGSVLTLNKLLTTPVVNALLDRISADLVIKVKAFADLDFVKLGVRQVKGAYKYYRILSIGSKIWRVASGIASPFTLIWTAGGPVLFQQLRDSVLEYLFHRQGRLLIYAWERHLSRERAELKPLLW
jgi:hypothetical protein